MPFVTIAAHYDGKHVQLDEQVALTPNARLIVTVLDNKTPDVQDSEREDFLQIAASGLAGGYDDDEIEYSEADLKR